MRRRGAGKRCEGVLRPEEVMAAAPRHSGPAAPFRLLDVPTRHPRHLNWSSVGRIGAGVGVGVLGLIGVGILGALIHTAFSGALDQPSSFLAAVVMVGGGIGLTVAWRSRARTREFIAAALEHRGQPGTILALWQKRAGGMPLTVLARALSGADVSATIVRFLPEKRLGPIEPLTVPIEPIVVHEGDATFAQLARGADVGAEDASAPPPGWRTIATWVGCAALFVFGCGLILKKMMERSKLEMFDIAICGVWILISLAPAMGAQHWLMAPQAVLVRTRRSLNRFTARESVLCVEALPKERVRCVVCDGKRVATGEFSYLELDGLLRAWLSPLPPPPPELTSELA
jgi:hypothetical protein